MFSWLAVYLWCRNLVISFGVTIISQLTIFVLHLQFGQMNWIKGLRYLTKQSKCITSHYSMVKKNQNGFVYDQSKLSSLRSPIGYNLERNMSWKGKFPCFLENVLGPRRYAMSICRPYVQSVQNNPDLSRDFLVQLWVEDRKKRKFTGKKRRKVLKSADHDEGLSGGQTAFRLPFDRLFSDASISEKSYDQAKPDLKQPPPSQFVTGILEPMSSEEVKSLFSCLLNSVIHLFFLK